ncbi:MAG: hypothetical protein GC180_03375 [Bacteroidetes bacterium]|nr:hypothetical protein [Bacteroidota bacterium]
MRYLFLSVFLFAFFLSTPVSAQYILPRQELLVDSGIRKIKIYKQEFGIYERLRVDEINLPDSFQEHLSWEIDLDSLGKIQEDKHWNHSFISYRRQWKYDDTGRIIYNSWNWMNLPDLSTTTTITDIDGGGYILQIFTKDQVTSIQKVDADNNLIYDAYYRGNDSTIFIQDVEQNKQVKRTYRNGKVIQLELWEWKMKNGKPVTYTELSQSFPNNSLTPIENKSEIFQVNEDGSLKLFGNFSGNNVYQKINFRNRYKKASGIQYNGPAMILDNFRMYSELMFEPSFTPDAPAYRLRYEYLKR